MSSHISFCGYLNIIYLLHFRDPKTDIEKLYFTSMTDLLSRDRAWALNQSLSTITRSPRLLCFSLWFTPALFFKLHQDA